MQKKSDELFSTSVLHFFVCDYDGEERQEREKKNEKKNDIFLI